MLCVQHLKDNAIDYIRNKCGVQQSVHAYSSYGERTFAAAGPRLWNSLPVQLHNPDISYRRFR